MPSATPRVVPSEGQHTLLRYYRGLPAEVSPLDRRVLNLLLRALTDRGWMPPFDGLMTQMEGEATEEALRASVARCVHLRMIQREDEAAAFTGLLGGLSGLRTPHRALLATGVDVYTHGAMELLCLQALTTYESRCATACGACEAPIRFLLNGDGVHGLSPPGLAGFQASWDGAAPLEEVHRNSPVLCSDGCLDTWQDTNPSVDGLPLSSQVFASLAVEIVSHSGDLRCDLVRTDR